MDAVLHWHAGDRNSASASSSLANKSAKFRFHGLSAHAAGAPERGRSALDGVEAMNAMVNMLREHVPQETRIHYVITSGGAAPNVVPDFAEVYYYVRNPDPKNVVAIFDRVVKAAEGAALGTDTRMDFEVIHGIYALLPNEALARRMFESLERVGGVEYTEEERHFGEVLQQSFTGDVLPLSSAAEVQEFFVTEEGSGGSTDVGDVSWVVPTAGLRTATWVPGTPAHSWQAIAAGGTSIGNKGMIVAAKTLTLTAIDVFSNPEIVQQAHRERDRRVGPDFVYESLVGDRAPPLDYRKTRDSVNGNTFSFLPEVERSKRDNGAWVDVPLLVGAHRGFYPPRMHGSKERIDRCVTAPVEHVPFGVHELEESFSIARRNALQATLVLARAPLACVLHRRERARCRRSVHRYAPCPRREPTRARAVSTRAR